MLLERHFSYLHHPDAKSDDKSDDYNWQNSSNYYANKCYANKCYANKCYANKCYKCQQASSYESQQATVYA